MKIGGSDGERSEVLEGLSAGDQVVTRANFLVDSESRLRASLGRSRGQRNDPLPSSASPPRTGGRCSLAPWCSLGLSVWTMRTIPLDALPDLSDTQVIVYSRWDRSPDILEDQVTYPITAALLGAPRVKAIRGYSDFGFSYVYVIFEDGRTRTGRGRGCSSTCRRSRPSCPPG